MSQRRQLLLVRHGLPDYRARLPQDEPPGPGLSELGRRQVRQAVKLLRHYQPFAIHTSPLARAQQSAEIIRAELRLPLAIDGDLKEWHRTELLYQVNERSTRWLFQWLAGDEFCAVVVGHASPLLSILRAALYLPHFGWWVPGRPDQLVLSTCDRFEISMGSLFELTFTPRHVTARCLFHPTPRVTHLRRGRIVATLPRPTHTGENRHVRRPNFGRLIGYRPW